MHAIVAFTSECGSGKTLNISLNVVVVFCIELATKENTLKILRHGYTFRDNLVACKKTASCDIVIDRSSQLVSLLLT